MASIARAHSGQGGLQMTPILLLEPDDERREAMQIALIDQGHTVTALKDATEANKLLQLGGYEALMTSDQSFRKMARSDEHLANLYLLDCLDDPKEGLTRMISQGLEEFI